jgi:hypothetical protein
LAQPRVGHLQQVFHIFAYLKAHSRSRILLDDSEPQVDNSQFTQADWYNFYPDATEFIPPNAPKPRGNPILISCFVDADHAGNRVTCRSHTGILIFCNRAPIIWFSKWQNTVETSSFGSEFVALRIATELIEALSYKLQMFGVPLKGPANVYCDNDSVVKNTTLPESTLNKKHNAIAYHKVRESVAAGTIRIAIQILQTCWPRLYQVHDLKICVQEFCSRIIQNHHLPSYDVFAGTNWTRALACNTEKIPFVSPV